MLTRCRLIGINKNGLLKSLSRVLKINPLLALLNYEKVEKDIFLSIQEKFMLLEAGSCACRIQQTSDVTYRVF